MSDRDKHRSRINIISSILKYIRETGKAKKTHILYATNLNTRSLEKFLDFLLRIHAIEKVKTLNGTRYQITERGNRILSVIENLEYMLRENGYNYKEKTIRDVIIAVNKVLEPLTGDTIESISRATVNGRSGHSYRVLLAIGCKKKYILVIMSEEEFICRESSLLCRILLYILDTDYTLILYIDNEASTTASRIKNTLQDILAPIDIGDINNRYIIVEAE